MDVEYKKYDPWKFTNQTTPKQFSKLTLFQIKKAPRVIEQSFAQTLTLKAYIP